MILTINYFSGPFKDGIEEWKEESWADTEQNLKDTLREILGIQNIKIERAHRVGDKNDHHIEQ